MTPELYQAIQSIRHTLYEMCERHDVTVFPRDDGPNPYYHQTATGLLLVQDYGVPDSLYTPLGSYQLTGGSSGYSKGFKSVTAEMLKSFGCECIREATQTKWGVNPALYTVAHVNGVKLPPYTARKSLHSDPIFDCDWIPYKDACARWAELTAAYEG